MKSTGWHFVHGGREIWAATKTEIRRLAQAVADRTGRAVKVKPGRRARKAMRRNPAPPKRAPGDALQAYNFGRAAAKRGDYVSENPYRSADLAAIWRKGFLSVRPVNPKPKKPKARRAAAARSSAVRILKPNPDPMAYLGVWRLQEENRQTRLARNKATKARRIAMSLRERRGQAKEAAAKKTGKFQVDAKGRRGESYTLFRPSRSAAEALASEFLAAGFKVKVSEA